MPEDAPCSTPASRLHHIHIHTRLEFWHQPPRQHYEHSPSPFRVGSSNIRLLIDDPGIFWEVLGSTSKELIALDALNKADHNKATPSVANAFTPSTTPFNPSRTHQ